MDADVIIVGAGPTGLTLAVELRMAGVDALVLERHPQIREVPKAGGLSGQIVELLRYRGLLERFEVASPAPVPALRLPFGEVHVDMTGLAEPPMHLLLLPQSQLEGVLDELARELGAQIRRGHEVVGLSQDGAGVVADVSGPDGDLRLAARYLVGCDGSRSRVRDLAGFAFPGITYPEVNRMGQTTVPEGVTVRENGDLEVAGVGEFTFGFTRTPRGVFATGSVDPERLGVFTSEEETADYDDDEPMTLAELADSIHRVLGVELPLGEPTRLTRFTFHARHVERYRQGRIMLAGDAAHLFPAPGVALNAGMMDSVNLAWKLAAALQEWAPAGLLESYHDERHLAGERVLVHTRAQVALRRGYDEAAVALRELFQELVSDDDAARRIGRMIAGTDIRYRVANPDEHPLTGTFALDPIRQADAIAELAPTARGVLLDLADRSDLREAALGWGDRIDIVTAEAADGPADALLLRPDAYVAWAAGADEPIDGDAAGLRDALATWFGEAK
jgi:2-polyprenyl-6-methoxyphenol hydroxylase-like FAD-dependent oxidoreductase